MPPPTVPWPKPRKVKKLPVLGLVAASVGGLLLFWFLWDIAVRLNADLVNPRRQERAWEPGPLP